MSSRTGCSSVAFYGHIGRCASLQDRPGRGGFSGTLGGGFVPQKSGRRHGCGGYAGVHSLPIRMILGVS